MVEGVSQTKTADFCYTKTHSEDRGIDNSLLHLVNADAFGGATFLELPKLKYRICHMDAVFKRKKAIASYFYRVK